MELFECWCLPHLKSTDIVEAVGELIWVPLDFLRMLTLHVGIFFYFLDQVFQNIFSSLDVLVYAVDAEAHVKRLLELRHECRPFLRTDQLQPLIILLKLNAMFHRVYFFLCFGRLIASPAVNMSIFLLLSAELLGSYGATRLQSLLFLFIIAMSLLSLSIAFNFFVATLRSGINWFRIKHLRLFHFLSPLVGLFEELFATAKHSRTGFTELSHQLVEHLATLNARAHSESISHLRFHITQHSLGCCVLWCLSFVLRRQFGFLLCLRNALVRLSVVRASRHL